MNMIIFWLILFILSCYGCTQILVFGSIFDKIRPKSIKFFYCPMCIGFHVGWIFYLLFYFSNIRLFSNFFIGCFIYACISSGTSYFLCNIIGDYGIQLYHKNKKED